MSDILVLNQSYMPIGKTTWDRAIILLILSKATSIKDSDKEIRSQFISLKIPEIIVLKDVAYYKHKTPPPTKKNVFARDNYTCLRCGEKRREKLSLEHLIPRSRFKEISKERNLEYNLASWPNVCCLCKDCNSWKDNRLPEEIGWDIKVSEPASDVLIDWNLLFDIGVIKSEVE